MQQDLKMLLSNLQQKIEGGLITKNYYKKTCLDAPLVSIITVCLNSKKYIEQTILSVINQTYKNIEYIIIDGGSTDGTLDVIRKYDDKISYWISEPDKGIYYAMNKGITKSTGEIIGIINSDDWYELDAVESVVKVFNSQKQIALVHGNLKNWTKNSQFDCITTPKLGRYSIYISLPLYHPSCFIRKQIYLRYGLFNTKINVVADYELILRLYKNKIKIFYLDKCIANMRSGGQSSTPSFFKQIFKANLEAKRINKYNCCLSLLGYYYSILKVIIFQFLKKYNLNVLIKFYRKYLSKHHIN